MTDWKEVCISPQTGIREALRKIDEGSLQIALVVDPSGRLLGTLTDGDVRRAILRGVSLDDVVSNVMNRRPTVASREDDREIVLATMRQRQIRHMPIVSAGNCVVGLETIDELQHPPVRDNLVLLMAGGLGSRLQPLTAECPKPMLPIGNRPILETILLNFVGYGFCRFCIAVNHQADCIIEHFGDGSHWGVQIQYVREAERLGTAGALSMLPEEPREPLMVMNGDVLTKVNLGQLLDFHVDQRAEGTMCVREYEIQVPFGVIRVAGQEILSIEEKPTQKCLVNAGVYVLSPAVLDLVPRNGAFDMTTLFERLVASGRKTAVFPLREYWLDVGKMSDFERANGEYPKVFG